MKRVVTLGVTLLLLLFTSFSMRNAARLFDQCQSVSLRYRQPFFIEESAEHSGTFWCEETALLSTDLRTEQSRVLFYFGDAALVYGNPCISGSLPGPLDQNGCVLSCALAQLLFGSENAAGLSIHVRDKEYIVSGIFEDEEPLALIADSSAAFTAAEFAVTGETIQDPEGWVSELLCKENLLQPDWILYNHELCFVVSILAWLPLLFGTILLAVWLFKTARNWPVSVRDFVLFMLALAAALSLPFFFSVWPQWLTPSRWSDFSWWGTVFEALLQHVRAFLTVIPSGRDVVIKTAVLKQFFFAAAQCVLCELLRCRLWHFENNKGI